MRTDSLDWPDEPRQALQDLQDLLQCFYQCPAGLIEVDGGGRVRKINPAASGMLLRAAGGADLVELFPVLGLLAPALVDLITGDPTRLGPLSIGRRVLIPLGPPDQGWLELLTARVSQDRIMLVLLDVSEERRLARHEHEFAVELQRSMLGRIDEVPGLVVSTTYRPVDAGRLVGGDWYDVVSLLDDGVGLVVGDAVGHSVSAAAVMGQLRSAIRAVAAWCEGPDDLLRRADDVAKWVEGGFCTTLTYVRLDRTTGDMSYGCAGHPPPLLIRADGAATFLNAGRRPPLACPVPTRVAVGRSRLRPGDTLLLYTDGLVERRGESLERGLDRLARCAPALGGLGTSEAAERLVEAMLVDVPTEDDVCVLVVHRPR